MAFGEITQSIKNSFRGGLITPTNANSFYSIQDIQIVLAQPGATKIKLINAVVDGDPVTVIIGVATIDLLGSVDVMDDVGHLIAVPCPPFTDINGGQNLSPWP